jgi:hypothetical protein
VALIRYDNPDEWLFAGVYKRNGVKKVGNFFEYDTDLLSIWGKN